MGTNVYHQASQDLFGPELSPARWRVPKGPGPKEVFELSENLDVYLDDGLALAGRQAFRLAAKRSERSLASRFEGLMAVSKAIAIHHEIEGLVSALASELFRVVDFDLIGMSRFEEVSNRVDWHLHRLGGGVERVSRRMGPRKKRSVPGCLAADAGDDSVPGPREAAEPQDYRADRERNTLTLRFPPVLRSEAHRLPSYRKQAARSLF